MRRSVGGLSSPHYLFDESRDGGTLRGTTQTLLTNLESIFDIFSPDLSLGPWAVHDGLSK
jgi:hypothetical protein